MPVDLGSAYGSIELGTEGAEQSIQSLASSLRGTGAAMSAAFTLPLVGIATAAVSSAAGFEQSMNVMQQVSGATAQQMASLQSQALQLGAETSFSAGEAASAMLELAKAGLSVDEVGAAIGGTMDLAAAGGLDLAQAAEITANAVNAFGLQASDANAVANMLAAAANASSVEVTDLAQGMNMASAVFASSGQSIESLNTALALLGNNGMKGSDAGTSLKTMMMRLSAPTDEAAAQMQALGISVYDAEGNMRSLPDVMADLQQAVYGTNAVTVTSSNLTADQAERMAYLKSTIEKTQRQLADYQSGIAGVAQSENDKAMAVDRLNRVLDAAQQEYAGLASVGGTTSTVMQTLTEEQRNQALTAIFGADAIRAVNILLKEGEDGWTDMAAALGDESAAADVANARMSGMAGAIEYFKGSVDSFLIGTALPFLDSMSGIVRQAADAISLFGALSQPVKTAAIAFGAVLAAAGPLTLGLSGVLSVVATMLSPLGLVVLAVGALAAAFASDFLGIRTLTVQAGLAIQQSLLMVYDAMRRYLTSTEVQRFAGQMQGAFAKVVTAARDLATGQTDVGSFVETVKGAFGSIDWTPVTQPFEGLRTKVVDGFNAIATYDYGAAFTGLRDAVVAKLGEIDWTPVTGKIDGLKTAVVNGVNAIATYDYGAAITGMRDAVAAKLGAIDWTSVTGKVDGLRTTVVDAVTNIDWVGTFNAAVDAVNGLRDGAIAWLSGAISGIGWQGVSIDFAGMVSALAQKIRSIDWSSINPISLFMPLVGRLIPGIGPALGTARWIVSSENFAGLVGSVKAAVLAIDWGAIGESLLGLVDAVKAAILGLDWAALSETATTVRDQVVALFTGIQLPGIDTSGWTATITQISDVMAPAFERLQGSLGTLPASMEELWPKVQSLGDAFGGLMTALQPIIDALGRTLVVAAVFGTNLLAAAIERLPGIVGPMIDQLTNTINLIGTAVSGVTSTISAIATGDWTAAWESLKSIVTAFETFVTNTWTNVTTMLGNVGGAIGESVVTTLNDLGLTDAATTVQNMINSIAQLKTDIEALFTGDKTLFGEDGLIQFETPEWIQGFLAWTWPGLPEWTWPTLPKFFWPTLPAWVWPGLPAWVWPAFPTFEWPTFETPGWVQALIDALNAFRPPWAAEGTNSAVGGLTMVGERGPEMVVMPPGAQVLTNGQTNRRGGGEGRVINVNLGGVTVNNEMDVNQLGYRLASLLEGFGV